MSAALAKLLEPLIRMIVRIVFEEWRRPTEAEVVGGGTAEAEKVRDAIRDTM